MEQEEGGSCGGKPRPKAVFRLDLSLSYPVALCLFDWDYISLCYRPTSTRVV